METTVRHALELWGMQDASCTLAAQRENTVWRIHHNDTDYALRFHRPLYRDAAQLLSELQWMQYLACNDMNVPDPIPTQGGALLGQIDTQHVTLLTWLPGRPIGSVGTLDDAIADQIALCHQLGRDMARLHDLSDAWQPPVGFTRPDWRADGLLGDQPLWGRFWDHPELDRDQRRILLDARDGARERLQTMDGRFDQGLIHADLLVENIMIADDRLALIDFDDGAIGYRDFELATFLLKLMPHTNYPAMRFALCNGYAARRAVLDSDLDFCLLLRALTYPGWIMARLHEPGGAARSARAISTAIDLSQQFLQRRER